jgi:cob(I)alamin adenosyltransferase
MAFKIYTKTGDKGETSLFGGKRLPKHHIRIDSYGTVDELNSYVGLLSDLVQQEEVKKTLKEIQDRLFTIGSNLASDPEKNMPVPDVLMDDVELLEKEMDKMDETLPTLKHFVLPGGHPTVSHCHIARCVCRRAERLVSELRESSPVELVIIQYLNRLSDYLFTLARYQAHTLGIEEVKWEARK